MRRMLLVAVLALVSLGCMLGCSGGPTAHEFTADLSTVALWHLNETAGTTAPDSSGLGRNLTLAGNASLPDWWDSSPEMLLGRSLLFDNTHQEYAMVTVSQALDDQKLSVELWFCTDDDTTVKSVLFKAYTVSGSPQYGFEVGLASGRIQAKVSYNSTSSAACQTDAVYNDGAWHYLACVYDKPAGTIAIYVDGYLQKTATGANVAMGAAVRFGLASGNAVDFYAGEIDEVRVSICARTASEIFGYYH